MARDGDGFGWGKVSWLDCNYILFLFLVGGFHKVDGINGENDWSVDFDILLFTGWMHNVDFDIQESGERVFCSQEQSGGSKQTRPVS